MTVSRTRLKTRSREATSQIAFPQDIVDAVYAVPPYDAKGPNTSVPSIVADNVFSDGSQFQMATVTGNTDSQLMATLLVGVALCSTVRNGNLSPRGSVRCDMPSLNLNHAVLFVSDLDRAVDFYTGVLGFSVAVREERMSAAFLRAPGSDNHHDLGLFQTPAPKPARGSVGLYHLAWQVDEIDDLLDLRDALTHSGSLTGQSHHGATVSLYGADPSGNELEIMWMLPREAWGEYEDKGVVMPLDLEAEVERWSRRI